MNLIPRQILGPEGPIAKIFDQYEVREPQLIMAEAVEKAFKDKRHLFVEAGTGVGKSYAFLIPAIAATKAGARPIVISTNSIALQEQIFNKDIPDLAKYLNVQLNVILRKGRSNYISLRRLKAATNMHWSTEELTEVEDIETWAEDTPTGTLQALNFLPKPNIWSEVQSDKFDCMGKKCPTYKECFYFKSRDEAERADIIITNHSLLAIDLLVKSKSPDGTGLLPKYQTLVIDEAHELEKAIRDANTYEWKQNSAKYLTQRALNKKESGVLDIILRKDVGDYVVQQVDFIQKQLAEFVKINQAFFDVDVTNFVKEDLKKQLESSVTKRIRGKELASSKAQQLVAIGKTIIESLQIIASQLDIYDKQFESKSFSEAQARVTGYLEQWDETVACLTQILFPAEDKQYQTNVASVEAVVSNKDISYTLISEPIFIKQLTRQLLFSKIPAIVLTSATLTTNGSFQHLTDRLGAIEESTSTLLLDHVFDYKKQMRLFLTPKIPIDPWDKPKERKAYFDSLSQKIDKYVQITKGNAFILCTSNQMMYELWKRAKERYTKAGLNVLRQGENLTKEQIIHEFKTVKNSVLYAVDSFWTGVDIPGDHLQLIIIPKIPFPPPTPLSEAQEEIYRAWNQKQPKHRQKNYFMDVTVPAVAIKLKQGVGRLIRRKTDRGLVVLMDQRLSTKPYGKMLLNSLPETTIVSDED